MKRTSQDGYQIIELIVALAILSFVAFLATPPLMSMTARLRVRLAAHEITSALHSTRTWAVRHRHKAALKFFVHEDRTTEFAVFVDGNGNGVRNREIESGTDWQAEPRRRLTNLGRTAYLGFPADSDPRDPGNPSRRIERLDDPVRFNRSDLASFDPMGTVTPGSVYLTDGKNQLAVVRLYNRTGRMKVLFYDFEEEIWK